MKPTPSKAWRQYEAGLEYKRRIGLFETVRRNERFYRGDQWGNEGGGLPHPVFNIVRRVTDYLVCSVASGNVAINFSDENLPYVHDPATAQALRSAVATLTRNAAYRWERSRMDSKIYRLLTDAAISGDGVLYCWWDPSIKTGQELQGDIATEVVDNVNLFVSDVNRADLQSQDYVILSGRAAVSALRAEARAAGCPEEDIVRIVPDDSRTAQSGQFADYELDDSDSDKATFIIKFWREDGRVVFEKSTRYAVIRRQSTPQTLYPVAYFNWHPTKNSFHGTSPITSLIPNQKYVNRAFAMVMKHMTDTAFSKVIYDKSRIPEWSNAVGEAIAANGGLGVSDAVKVVESEGGEAVMPDFTDFILYGLYDEVYRWRHFSGSFRKAFFSGLLLRIMLVLRLPLRWALSRSRRFEPPVAFRKLRQMVNGVVSLGQQTGEGWLLTAEMMELLHGRIRNILCMQPFGCLPNHITGKGVIKELKRRFPEANIAAVDYDPGASEVNQINRIKLMMAVARQEKSGGEPSATR